MLIQLQEPGQSNKRNKKVIGIDLGTTHSVLAYSTNQNPVILKRSHEDGIIPSLISYSNNKKLYGYDVKANDFGAVTIGSIKRLMDKSPHSWAKVCHLFPQLNFNHFNEELLSFSILGSNKTVVEMVSELIAYLKNYAEEVLQEDIEQAVITVPAYFDEGARQATKDAAKLAGLEVLRLINEPTAAAFAYGLDKNVEGIYGIYDFGGGTFDFSILQLTAGVFQVLATGGHTNLGGDDIDRRIVEYFVDNIQKNDHQLAMSVARKMKEDLSKEKEVKGHFPGHTAPSLLDEGTLMELSLPYIEQTLEICSQVLLDANLNIDSLDGVVLVGGSSLMPIVRETVEKFFHKKPLSDINPEEIVALGAALQAEAITKGSDTLLIDVTPLSLGIEVMGGIVEKIIPRNSPIPCIVHQSFTTFQDGQTAMKIHVVQGEREFVKDCRSLGEFILTGIPPMPAGMAKIKVQFSLDANGLLVVSAQEQETKIHQEIQVRPAYGLTEEALFEMLKEGALNGVEDIQNRLREESRVEAERLYNTVEKAISNDGELLNQEEKIHIQTEMNKLKKLMENNQTHEIKNQAKVLMEVTQNFAERRVNKYLQQQLTGQNINSVID